MYLSDDSNHDPVFMDEVLQDLIPHYEIRGKYQLISDQPILYSLKTPENLSPVPSENVRKPKVF